MPHHDEPRPATRSIPPTRRLSCPAATRALLLRPLLLLALLGAAPAWSAPVLLDTWTAESYPAV